MGEAELSVKVGLDLTPFEHVGRMGRVLEAVREEGVRNVFAAWDDYVAAVKTLHPDGQERLEAAAVELIAAVLVVTANRKRQRGEMHT